MEIQKVEVKKEKRYTAAHVLAQEFSWDFADMQERRYQYGRTNRPIYEFGGYYWSAVKEGQKPAKHDNIEYEWEKHPSTFAASIGWQIWKCKSEG